MLESVIVGRAVDAVELQVAVLEPVPHDAYPGG
jgi:hypothetical protein